MDPTVIINERVDVYLLFRKEGGIDTLCQPLVMRWRGRDIKFEELALRHPTAAGKRMLHVFHMSDGANGYRLEFDAEVLTWKLISVMAELP